MLQPLRQCDETMWNSRVTRNCDQDCTVPEEARVVAFNQDSQLGSDTWLIRVCIDLFWAVFSARKPLVNQVQRVCCLNVTSDLKDPFDFEHLKAA